MQQLTRIVFCGLLAPLVLGSSAVTLAHYPRSHATAQAPTPTGAKSAPAPGISGQGKMKFRVLYTSERLPEEARKVLIKAHGGFAVDRRPGKEETYFALPGAGILQISADLRSIRVLPTAEPMKDV